MDAMTPTGTMLGAALVAVAAVAGFALALGGLMRNRPPEPAPWRWLTTGLGLFAVAAVLALVSDLFGIPAASIPEAFYVPGYLPAITGMVMLARRERRGDPRAAAIDATIVAIAVGVISWVRIVAPLLDDAVVGGAMAAAVVAFPLVDLALLALAGYFVLGGGSIRPAGAWLALGVAALALADLAYIDIRFQDARLFDIPDLLWAFAYVALGLAVTHPSMATIGDDPPDHRARLTIGHVLVLGASVAVGPVVLIVQQTGGSRDVVPEIATIVIAALVILRIALMGRALEQALVASRANEERLQRALDAASMATWDRDVATGRVVRSDGMARLFGMPECSDGLGGQHRALVHPEDLPTVRAMDEAILGDDTPAEAEYRVQTPAGETRWLRERGRALRDASGAVVRVLGVTQDVTVRKLAELASAESELRLGALIGQIPVVVYVWPATADASDAFVSPLAERWFGLPPGDYTATWSERLHPEDREAVMGRIGTAMTAHRGYRLEYRERTAGGRFLWVRDEAVLLRDEQDRPRYWIGVKSDVSARRVVEEDLRAAKDAAEAASRLKSEFLSTVSHELRTPMNAIIGYTHLLLDGTSGELTPVQESDIRQIADGADRLLALIDDVLDISRIEAGRLPVILEPTSVEAAVADVLADLAPLAADKGLSLSAAMPGDLPSVLADPARLRQILLNLLGNAIKFTDRGAVTVSADVVADCVDIAVADTGIGISPEALRHVFDEFRQADASTTRRFGGAGLGLTIARNLAEMQGGSIRVESEVGRGSTFTLSMPVAAANAIAPRS